MPAKAAAPYDVCRQAAVWDQGRSNPFAAQPGVFDGPQGMRKLPPLAQRLHTDFDTDIRFDNPRAPQIRLRPFDFEMLMEVGRKVRGIFADGSSARERILQIGDDALIESLAKGVAEPWAGKRALHRYVRD